MDFLWPSNRHVISLKCRIFPQGADMAMTNTLISRLKTAATVDIAREADNGLLTPCIKEAVGVRIELATRDGLITPCIKEPERIAIDQVADGGLIVPCIKETDGFITPCISDAGGIRFERAADDGLIVPCVREADVITIAVQGDIFIRGTQAGTNGETLMDYAVSDRPYWDQNSRDSYDPAAEVTVSGRSPYYSSDVFLIA